MGRVLHVMVLLSIAVPVASVAQDAERLRRLIDEHTEAVTEQVVAWRRDGLRSVVTPTCAHAGWAPTALITVARIQVVLEGNLMP